MLQDAREIGEVAPEGEHVLDRIAALARELGVGDRIGVGVPGLLDQELGMVTASPNLKAMEQGDYMAAWGGVAGLQLALSVVWTEAARRGHTLVDVVRWMCEGPARLARLVGVKGAIVPGAHADLVIFDDAGTTTVVPERVEHRHKVTPYAGEQLRGAVRATYLRGDKIAEDGKVLVTESGALL